MRLVVVLVGLWAVAFAASFVHFHLTEPTDFGFTRGLNRLEPWAAWQAVALALAVVALVTGRRRGVTHWLSALPLAVSGALLAAIAALIVYVVATS